MLLSQDMRGGAPGFLLSWRWTSTTPGFLGCPAYGPTSLHWTIGTTGAPTDTEFLIVHGPRAGRTGWSASMNSPCGALLRTCLHSATVARRLVGVLNVFQIARCGLTSKFNPDGAGTAFRAPPTCRRWACLRRGGGLLAVPFIGTLLAESVGGEPAPPPPPAPLSRNANPPLPLLLRLGRVTAFPGIDEERPTPRGGG